jgi:hypothetical protein
MNLSVHVVGGGIFSTLWFGLTGFKDAVAFFCFASFLDIDHYLYFIIKFNNWNIRKAFKYFHSKKYTERFCLCIFHTVEFIVLFGLITYFSHSRFFYSCFMGLMLHFMIDVMQGLYYRRMHYRWWSLIEYYLATRDNREAGKVSLISSRENNLEGSSKGQSNQGGFS